MSVTVPRKTAVQSCFSACTSLRSDPGTVKQVHAAAVSSEAAVAIANAKTNTMVIFIAYSNTGAWIRPHPQDAERQASAGARDGVKGKEAISLRALRCMR